MLENNFANWRLRVDGLVANTLDLSLAELLTMPQRTQITRHDCVEGWSAIGKWQDVPLAIVLQRATLLPAARFVVFHCATFLNKRSTVPDNIMTASISSTHSIRKPFLRTVSMASR